MSGHETAGAGMQVKSVVRSHEIKMGMDDCPIWISVCSVTSEFRGNSSRHVVPKKLIPPNDLSSVHLPEPCLVASLSGKNYLVVLSFEKNDELTAWENSLQIHCADIDLRFIGGLHCERDLVFVMQPIKISVIDLSGKMICILEQPVDRIWGGICSSAAHVFVSFANTITVYAINKIENMKEQIHKKTTERKATSPKCPSLVTLQCQRYLQIDLNKMVFRDNSFFVIALSKVQKWYMEENQIILNPYEATFTDPKELAVDGRGHFFVSNGRSLQAADESSLLWTLEEFPIRDSSSSDRLSKPCGLAVVMVGSREMLVVADSDKHRLVVLDISEMA